MKIAFRVDASDQIGTGHLVRCLTLASALKHHGARTRIISREMPNYLQKMVTEGDHEFAPLNNEKSELALKNQEYSNWLGVNQLTDAQHSLQVLSDEIWDWIVVDHYALNSHWESTLRKITKKILVIDDIANRQHDCNVLLDQNFYIDAETRYIGKVPDDCQLLLGPRYALLREEFRQLRKQINRHNLKIKRVLVFFGGIDKDNLTSITMSALENIRIEGLHVDVVIGSHHPHHDAIKSACAKYQFDCHVQTTHMADLTAAADLAIGAGGSANWERCCLGLPAVIVSVADNQTEIAKSLSMIGAVHYIGFKDIASTAVIQKAILDLINNSNQVASLSEKSYSLVDGLGTDRLCRVMGY